MLSIINYWEATLPRKALMVDSVLLVYIFFNFSQNDLFISPVIIFPRLITKTCLPLTGVFWGSWSQYTFCSEADHLPPIYSELALCCYCRLQTFARVVRASTKWHSVLAVHSCEPLM